jgi:MoxR-like ATPase
MSEPGAIPAEDPLAAVADLVGRLRGAMRARIVGRDDVIDLVIVALLADGHVLLEDYPGSGKTTLAKTLGEAIVAEPGELRGAIVPFRRIQFTPDLLPSDVTGVSIFDAASGQFHFRHGPIFAAVVLADEINRTSPKVQAAMLEAMAEKQVTVENVTHPLDALFFVIATQNPLDLVGTYPLPVSQLDRFLFKIRMTHIARGAEMEVLEGWRERRDASPEELPRVGRGELLAARRSVESEVWVAPAVRECLVDLCRDLRDDERVLQGPSTRSMVLALPALQAHALLEGRDFVSSEDVARLAPYVFAHRLELAPGVEGSTRVVEECMVKPLERLSRSTLRRR